MIWQLWPDMNIRPNIHIRSELSDHVNANCWISFLSHNSNSMAFYLNSWLKCAPDQVMGLFESGYFLPGTIKQWHDCVRWQASEHWRVQEHSSTWYRCVIYSWKALELFISICKYSILHPALASHYFSPCPCLMPWNFTIKIGQDFHTLRHPILRIYL